MAKLALTLILVYYSHLLVTACVWLSLQTTLVQSLFAFIKPINIKNNLGKKSHILAWYLYFYLSMVFGYFFILFYIFFI